MAQPPDEIARYPVPEESKQREGVTYGEWVKAPLKESRIFPASEREIQVYVPDGWDGVTPACVCVMLDNAGFNMPVLLSNLIAAKELPMTFIVVVPPGRTPGARGDPDSARANRTFEYDTPSPALGRFILEEVFPFAGTLATKDGRKLLLSENGNDRMIAGASSGAAAAFNAAWAFPGEFPRVFSAIGSYTGLRGSFGLPTLLHKTEAKPIRIFLQSGENDMWTAFGDWWSANNAMARALEFAGYDFRHAFGVGGHNGIHATHLAPAALRYLWKGWPAEPVKPAGQHRNHFLRELLIPGKPFVEVTDLAAINPRLISDGKGGVYISDIGRTRFIDAEGNLSAVENITKGRAELLAAGANDSLLLKSGTNLFIRTADGKTIQCKAEKGTARTENGDEVEFDLTLDVTWHHATPLRSGNFLICGKPNGCEWHWWHVWLVKADGICSSVASVPYPHDSFLPLTLAVDASGQWLYSFDTRRRGYSSRIEADDTLSNTQEFFHIHVPEEYDGAEIRGAVCDRSGRTYLATTYGVQVCDYNGRSTAILPLPDNEKAISVAFGGKDMDVLYVLGEDSRRRGKIYARPLKAKGDSVFQEPAKIRVGAG